MLSFWHNISACEIDYCAETPSEIYQYIVNNNDFESYNAVLPNTNDNGLDSTWSILTESNFAQKFNFPECKYVNYNITLTAFLFKTEIFPNEEKTMV